MDGTIELDARIREGHVSFTIEFETPYAPRMIDASHDAFALEDLSLMDRE